MKLFLGVLSLVLALGLFIGNRAQAQISFVYCSEASPSTFNPQMAVDGPTFNASSSVVYNPLVKFKTGETVIEPALAESWTISKDGLTFTFKLRKNVSFHTSPNFTPTRSFNADDVLFSFNRMRDPKHPYHNVSGGKYEYFEGMEMAKIIKEIVKVDDHTVKFVLSRVEAPFLANLAMDFASVLSAEYGDQMMKAKTPAKMDTDPIGTGPFMFVSYQKDTLIRYKANPTYWNGKPAIERLIYAITPDASVRAQKLKAGECHLIAEPNPADLPTLRKDGNIAIQQLEGLNVGYLAFNVEKKPFSDVRVRRAINHALNRASYLEKIYMGNASLAKNPIPPTMWSYNKATKDYEYNIQKAKDLLKEAGLPNGFEAELWTLPVSRPYNPQGKKMGELMQADLAQVGIKVKLVSYDWPTYLARSRKGEHQMIQLGWSGDNGDPDNFMNVLLGCASVTSGSNVSRWCHQPFQDLVTKGKLTSDMKARTKFYEQAQVVFKDQAPWATLAHAKTYRALSKKVSGYKIHPFGTEYFDKVSVK